MDSVTTHPLTCKCGLTWQTRSARLKVTCPNCGKKVTNLPESVAIPAGLQLPPAPAVSGDVLPDITGYDQELKRSRRSGTFAKMF